MQRGDRPRGDDLERIVANLRGRRERGLPAIPPRLAWLSRLPARADPVARIRALQTLKLRGTVAYAYRHIPYYRETWGATGVKPTDIRTLEDIRKLPITRRQTFASRTEAFISEYPGLRITTCIQTTGTTGRALRVFLTAGEAQYYAAGQAIAGLAGGLLGPDEIIQTHCPQDISVGALLATLAAHKAGSLCLTFGPTGTLDEHLASLFAERQLPGKRARVSWLMLIPSHLWALTRRAEELGYDLRGTGLKRINVASTMVSQDLKA